VSSVVGFALIGGAMLSEFRGTRTRKTLWFLVGALVVWIVNVLRVFSIIAIGKLAGQHIAIDVLHPVLGLFTFAAGMVLMLLIAGWFGLELKWLDKPAKSMPPSGLGGSVADPARRERPEAVKRTAVALVIVISLGLVLGGSNQTLRKFDLVADASGAPRLAAFLNYPSRVQGWRALHTASYDWVRSLFGTDANWFRYQYQWNARQAAFLRTASPVYADVISTSDPGALSTYGVEACYRFHGYNLKSDRIVDLGGLYGKVVSYHNDSKNVDWTAVYWQWPVQSPSGTKYERVTLILANTQAVVVGQTALNGYQTGRITAPKPREGQTPKELALQQSEQFLVAFAKQLVAHQPAAA
jgi:exosortase/archaeosortase family protein